MKLLASLTNRIFLASALLAVITIGVAVYLVSARLTAEAEGELERTLLESADLLEEQRSAVANQFVLLARLVADLPRFKAAVETQDPRTIAQVIEYYQEQLGADLLVVTDRYGRQLAGPPTPGDAAAQASVREALAGREAAAFWHDPRGLMQVATVPIGFSTSPPEVLGTLTAGFLLDNRRADQLRHTTASDIAFALDGRIVASTLPALVQGDAIPRVRTAAVTHIRLGSEDYAATAVPLSVPLGARGTNTHRPLALVLRSRSAQLRALRTINSALLATAALAIALATVLSYVVSRSITRPLGAITAAMREMAATGDLARKIDLRGPAWWQDEDARLLAATFNTLTDSIARFQRETAQRDRLLSLGRLSTVIAHEVRNPLMIIKAALRSLRPGTPEAEQRDAVGDIDEQVGRLNRIVHDVLDFARPLRFEYAPADLSRVCADAAAAVRAGEPDGPGIAVRVPRLSIVTDAERLRSALINLLANARHAVQARRQTDGQAGGVTAAVADDDIAIEAARLDHGRVRITVRDRGTGIPEDQIGQIFEPYFTTKRAGTGLGLPIARNIVEGLGGTIIIRAGSPGTAIDIELPEAVGSISSDRDIS